MRRGVTRWMVVVMCPIAVAAAPPGAAQLRAEATPADTGAARAMLYDQTDAASGSTAPDADFEAAFDVYDAEAADDFAVSGERWWLEGVLTVGEYGGAGGPASSVDLAIRQDAAGFPGMVVPGCSYPGLAPTTDTSGTFFFALPRPCPLDPGTYWLVQQTNISTAAGDHEWSTRSAVSGYRAVWRNPGDGYGTGCTDWGTFATCSGEILDFLFAFDGTLLPPLTSDVELGPEIPLPLSTARQNQPSIAHDSVHDEFLVVWHEQTTLQSVHAQRISADGGVLETFEISPGDRHSISPDVAYDPELDRYLVVWLYDSVGDGSDWDVVGRFVQGSGAVVTWPMFFIELSTENQWDPEVAYDPVTDEFLVVYTSATSGVPEYVQAARVNATDPLGSFGAAGLTVASGTDPRRNPDVAYNASHDEYLVVYDVETALGFSIAGTRLSADGQPQAPGELTIQAEGTANRHPAVASCAGLDQYLVVHEAEMTAGNRDIWTRSVQGNGTVDAYTIFMAASPANEAEPSVSCAEGLYAIAWHEGDGTPDDRIVGSLLTWVPWSERSFTVAATAGLRETQRAAVARGKLSSLVAWEQDRGTGGLQDIRARVVWPWLWADDLESGDLSGWSAAAR